MKRLIANSSLSSFLIIVMAVLMSSIVIRALSPADFWNDFLSNALATLFGVAIGVPVALLVSEWQETISTRDRTRKMMTLLERELGENLMTVRLWLSPPVKDTSPGLESVVFLNSLLKDDLWTIFTDGGEIQWIKDLAVLEVLADAYHALRSLRALTGRLIDILHLGQDTPLVQKMLLEVKHRADYCEARVLTAKDHLYRLNLKGMGLEYVKP